MLSKKKNWDDLFHVGCIWKMCGPLLLRGDKWCMCGSVIIWLSYLNNVSTLKRIPPTTLTSAGPD